MAEREDYNGKGLAPIDPAKGRVAIPASLRATLAANAPRADGKDGGTVFVAPHPRYRCLVAYDPAFVTLNKAQLREQNQQQIERGGAFDYNYFDRAGAAEPLPFDGSGRFILPAFELKFARITTAAAFIGTLDWINIWDPRTLIETDGVTDYIKEWVAFECDAKGIAL